MIKLCGTFDSAKASEAWSNLFPDQPQSIHDICVIGLNDKTTGEKREFVAIDRVLEIIDKQYHDACDRYSRVGYVEAARNEIRELRRAVKALGEEQG